MATSSERSPPPFPDIEDQDAQDPEEVRGRDSDEDDGEELFLSAVRLPGAVVRLAVTNRGANSCSSPRLINSNPLDTSLCSLA